MFRNVFRVRTAVAALALVAALAGLGAAVLTGGSADALPANETGITYYSDATLANIVGERIRFCNGSLYSWGRISAYYDSYSIPCDNF